MPAKRLCMSLAPGRCWDLASPEPKNMQNNILYSFYVSTFPIASIQIRIILWYVHICISYIYTSIYIYLCVCATYYQHPSPRNLTFPGTGCFFCRKSQTSCESKASLEPNQLRNSWSLPVLDEAVEAVVLWRKNLSPLDQWIFMGG